MTERNLEKEKSLERKKKEIKEKNKKILKFDLDRSCSCVLPRVLLLLLAQSHAGIGPHSLLFDLDRSCTCVFILSASFVLAQSHDAITFDLMSHLFRVYSGTSHNEPSHERTTSL